MFKLNDCHLSILILISVVSVTSAVGNDPSIKVPNSIALETHNRLVALSGQYINIAQVRSTILNNRFSAQSTFVKNLYEQIYPTSNQVPISSTKYTAFLDAIFKYKITAESKPYIRNTSLRDYLQKTTNIHESIIGSGSLGSKSPLDLPFIQDKIEILKILMTIESHPEASVRYESGIRTANNLLTKVNTPGQMAGLLESVEVLKNTAISQLGVSFENNNGIIDSIYSEIGRGNEHGPITGESVSISEDMRSRQVLHEASQNIAVDQVTLISDRLNVVAETSYLNYFKQLHGC
jgi:hypothetical protein